MSDLKRLESLIIKHGAYLAKELLYDEEAKPDVRKVERWRDAAMDLLMYSKQVCTLCREQESELTALRDKVRWRNYPEEKPRSYMKSFLVKIRLEEGEPSFIDLCLWAGHGWEYDDNDVIQWLPIPESEQDD